MAANRVRVQLLQYGRMVKAEKETNLDHRDAGMLRRLLEQMVLDHHGTLKLDLSNWSLRVYSPRGGAAIAKLSVTRSGETELR